MEFLRKLAQQSAEGFKEIADEVWSELGDTSGAPQEYKDLGKSAGKYALTAQLLMTLNFPDEAELFRDSFNATGKGPTGVEGFAGTPIAHMLESVAEASATRNAAAIGTQGFSDVTQTSTYDDLGKLLPQLREAFKEK